ncbi:DUF3302 domain-containing protein [Roseibium hamelinense]|uniref:DUF3302 domain-containing protein n=1 Tax=Roseibium hamelinense TaxID=150831 RepID=UPI0014788B69|nr:DUF3302 domain-containing protein [Roseibium hamelinense]
MDLGLIDFELDGYDYLTFAVLVVVIIALFYALIQIASLPGKLAERRKHPHAESVKMMGWIGLFTVFPWVHALIWAYHDSVTIDVRKFLGKREEDGSGGPANPIAERAAQAAAGTRKEPVFSEPRAAEDEAGEGKAPAS